MKHAPAIEALHPGLVRLFAKVAAEPERWFTVAELMTAGTVSRATVYRRCGNLVAARVFRHRPVDGHAQFGMNPGGLETALGQALKQRASAAS